MSSIKKILIAIDDESNENIAIQKGLALASAHRAEIVIFCVLKNTDELADSFSDVIPKEEFYQHLLKYHRIRIEELVNNNNPDNVDVTLEFVAGIPFVETIHKAFSIDADIILHSSHSEEYGRLFFSSSDWHLIRKSPVPVWIIKDKQPRIPDQIMVAIDVMNESGDTSFNKRILNLAVDIAHHSNAQLAVFSAWKLLGEEMLRHSPFLRVSQQQFENLLESAASTAQEKHNELKAWLHENSSITMDNITWHLEKGDAREIIPTFANDHNIGLLIMGTVNRTGIPGFLIGNTAETVLSKLNAL